MIVEDILKSDSEDQYLENTVYALGVSDPEYSDASFQRWLRSHFHLGYLNQWKAVFRIGDDTFKRARQGENKLAQAVFDCAPSGKIVNFSGSLNTILLNKEIVNNVRKMLREKPNIEIISIIGRLLMVNDGKNPWLDLSEEFPDNIGIYSLNENPFLQGIEILDGAGSNGNRYLNWSTPHQEHETFRSSITINKPEIKGLLLNEYDLSVDDIHSLNRVRVGAYSDGMHDIKDEREFTVNNYFKSYLEQE